MSSNLVVIENQFKPLVPRMEAAIPAAANLPVKQVMQSILIACERNDKLLDCTPLSLHQCAFSACALGLLVDGVTGQGYMVPYKGQAQFQIGFKGYSTIAARSGFILGGGVVYEGDQADIMLGTGGHVRVPFKPENRRPGAKIVAAYATLESNRFPSLVDAMSVDEIEAIRRMSKATYADAPWNNHYAQMAIKTIKKRLAKSAPLDIMQLASAFEDATDQGHNAYIRPEDRALIIDQSEAGPVTPMQPAPTEAFTVRDTVKFEVIFGDGVVRDLGSLENWNSQIWARLQKVDDPAALKAFLDRNEAVFAKIAERHPRDVDRLRINVQERVQSLRAAASGQGQAQNAQGAGLAQENGPSDADIVYRLILSDGERTFESEGAYAVEYRKVVAELFSAGKSRELLAFDQANKPHIASIVGLADTVASINAEIRRPAGSLV